MENETFESVELLMAEVVGIEYLSDTEQSELRNVYEKLLYLPGVAAVAAANAIFSTMYTDIEERKQTEKALKIAELERLIKVKMEEIAEIRKEIAALADKRQPNKSVTPSIIPFKDYCHTFPDGSSARLQFRQTEIGDMFHWDCADADGVNHDGVAESLTGVCKAVQAARGKGGNMNASRWFASFKIEEPSNEN